jgi:hypothetical protein
MQMDEKLLQHTILQQNKGQGMVEYVLLILGVSLIVLISLITTGTSAKQAYCQAVYGMGGPGCGCTFDFADPSELENWDGENKEQFTIVDGKVCIAGDGSSPRTYLNACSTDFGTDDFIINVNGATAERTVDNSKNSGFDIKFRSQDAANGYHFTYNAGKNFVRFWKLVSGKWVRLAHANVPSEWSDEELNFQIIVEGNHFTALRDEEVILEATDSAYPEGNIGLRNKPSSLSCFDNMHVHRLP